MSKAGEVRGAASLQRKLLLMPERNRRAAAQEIKVGVVNIEAGSKIRCPVVTGHLRNHQTHEVSDDGLEGRAGSNVHYDPHVEFGTRWMSGTPHLLPSFEEEHPLFMARLRTELDAANRGVSRSR